MKKLLIGLFLIAGSIAGQAQAVPCDPAQNGLAISPGTINIGQTADIVFTVYNGGTSPACSVAPNTVTVVLSLPSDITGAPKYYAFQSFVSPAPSTATTASGAYFDWQYLPAPDNVIIGTNRNAIPNGVGEANVTIRVIGTAFTAATGAISDLNIQVSSGSNNTANDVSNAPLIVAAPVAVTLSDISVVAADCLAKIVWKTSSEEIGTNFGLEYSPDGVLYVKVATLPGRSLTGSSYDYSYNQGYGKGFYRLKITKANGTYTYSRVVTSFVSCNVKKVFIYPNPLQVGQLLNVNVTGYEGKIRSEMMTSTGQVLFNREMQNGLNHLDVGKLPEGVYNLRITDDSGVKQNYKVVIVK